MPTVELSAGTIHYEKSGPEDGRPVVFVHGYAMGGSLWRPLGEVLGARGLRCIAPTWPLGAHPEALRPEAALTMESIAALVDEFLAALGLDDVVLVGNDTGGAVAQIVAVDHGARVGALVLTSCDAFEHFPPPILKPFIAAARLPGPAFVTAMAPLRTRFGRRRAFGALSHGDLDELVREWLAPAFADKGVRRDLRRFTASLSGESTRRAAELLPGFERPALIAWSADDAFFPLEDGERLAATLPDARLEVIDGARTFSMLDRPDRLAALVGDFATRPELASPDR
jgi:pimeloyl-ACP methyl ester carboxylesterase